MSCICPICGGKGEIKESLKGSHAAKALKQKQAKKLRDKGYSIREIAKLMGYASTSPVHRWLNK